MRRHIHYEAAFEDFLRSKSIPYVAVDEHRQAIFDGARVKSFDFLVYGQADCTWLVDIKGRKFPYDTGDGQKRYWENWVTRADLDGLTRWQAVFGDQFAAYLVFAYVLSEPGRKPGAELHAFRGADYAFYAVSVGDYLEACRGRSASWDTLSMPVQTFRRCARPIQEMLNTPAFTPAGSAV
jgi:hypothetical protein